MSIQKILLTTVAVVLATPAFASFYLGAQAGGSLMRGNINIADQNVQQNTLSHTRGMGADFGAQLGYIHQLTASKMFILGEGYFIKESGKAKLYGLAFQTPSTATPADFTVKPTNNYGAALGFGLFMNPKFNIYAKVGFESKGIATTYTLPGQTQTFSGVKKTAWSISPGAGFMYKITDSIAINPEYTYVIGKTYKALPQTTNADGTYSKCINFTPTEHRLMLKLNYMFG
ncbi:MAG: outer membrane beta-barrel protein [Pseudomonadota bacterium]